MLIKLSDSNGSPLYLNPQYVIAVNEEKHFGRPGVAADGEYRDTLILTTKGEFNVQDSPEDVAREVNRAFTAMYDALGAMGATVDAVLPPDKESA
jgi:hypothetical protein